MTPEDYAKKPHVMVWTDEAKKQQTIRFFHREGAHRACRIHNNIGDTTAMYVFDPKGERFPRDD